MIGAASRYSGAADPIVSAVPVAAVAAASSGSFVVPVVAAFHYSGAADQIVSVVPAAVAAASSDSFVVPVVAVFHYSGSVDQIVSVVLVSAWLHSVFVPIAACLCQVACSFLPACVRRSFDFGHARYFFAVVPSLLRFDCSNLADDVPLHYC